MLLICLGLGSLAHAGSALPDFDRIEFERFGQDSHYFMVMRGDDPELVGYQIKVARNPQRTVFGYLKLPVEHPLCKRLDRLFQRQLKVRQARLDRRPASTWLTVRTHSKRGEKLYHRAFADRADPELFNDLESLARLSQN